MIRSTIEEVLFAPPEQVWQIVTETARYPAWRSDVSRVEAPVPGQWIEHTADGFSTAFATAVWEPCRRWEFDLENANLTGRWSGLFFPCAEGTRVRFTEQVQPKKWFLRPLVGGYLKKQQARFLRELRQALPEQPSSENSRGGDAPC